MECYDENFWFYDIIYDNKIIINNIIYFGIKYFYNKNIVNYMLCFIYL